VSEASGDASRDLTAAVAALLEDRQEDVDAIAARWDAEQAALTGVAYLAASAVLLATRAGKDPVAVWATLQDGIAIMMNDEDPPGDAERQRPPTVHHAAGGGHLRAVPEPD
jgi:hypothetical protein